jgi:transcriptional regulator with XRE-family HTH domain
MHNANTGRRGAPKQRGDDEARDVLSPQELDTRDRGLVLKRYVRAAAAIKGLFEDEDIAAAAGIHRNTIQGWWRGTRPAPESLRELAEATDLSFEDLTRFVYLGGPPPLLPEPVDVTADDEERVSDALDGGAHRGVERRRRDRRR